MTIKRQRGRAVKEARCREGHKERERQRGSRSGRGGKRGGMRQRMADVCRNS